MRTTPLCILCLMLASPLYAEVCDKERPLWNGDPMSMWQEAAFILTSPLMILLNAATIIAVFYKTRLACGMLSLIWASFIPIMLTRDLDDMTWAGIQEGCIGHPDLFIGICAAICVVTIYIALRPRKRTTIGDTKCSRD